MGMGLSEFYANIFSWKPYIIFCVIVMIIAIIIAIWNFHEDNIGFGLLSIVIGSLIIVTIPFMLYLICIFLIILAFGLVGIASLCEREL